MHKVAGQNRIVTIILKPETTGFSKRHAMCFGPKSAPDDVEAPRAGARELLQGIHDWMFQNALPQEELVALSRGAKTLKSAQKQAVNDHIAELEKTPSEHWESKLRFYPSDTLRQANF